MIQRLSLKMSDNTWSSQQTRPAILETKHKILVSMIFFFSVLLKFNSKELEINVAVLH